MEPNDIKKPRITENRDYDENGGYDPSPSPEERRKELELLRIFNEHLSEVMGDWAPTYATAYGDFPGDS